MKLFNTLLSVILFCLLLGSSVAQAQAGRVPPIPENAPRAYLEVRGNNTVLINGDPFRLSAAAQIRDPDNRILLSQSIPQNQKYYVRLLLDQSGALYRAWILTPEEAEKSYPRFKVPSKSN